MTEAFAIRMPQMALPVESPIFDVFHCRDRYIGMVGPYCARAAFSNVEITIHGEKCAWWMLPDDRAFTMTIMAEIPSDVRTAPGVVVEVRRDGVELFRKTVYSEPYRGSLAMATLVKHDEHYLLEWIEHHRKLGVRHFYIYNNGNPQITEILKDTEKIHPSRVTEIPWVYPYNINYSASQEPFWPADSHVYTQCPQQMHAILKYGDCWDWIGLFDADEFIMPQTDETLIETLERAGQGMWCESPYVRCGGVQLSGKWFGTSNHKQLKTPVVENYKRCEAGHTASTKWFVKPACVNATVVHYHQIEGQPAVVPTNVLRYNHYRSISSFKGRSKNRDHEHYSNEMKEK